MVLKTPLLQRWEEEKDEETGRTVGAQNPLLPRGPDAKCPRFGSKAIERRLPSAAAITARGSRKKPSSTVILNVCRVANELCQFKKKANTNLKTWIKPKSPDPHCMRPRREGVLMGDGADKGGGLYS